MSCDYRTRSNWRADYELRDLNGTWRAGDVGALVLLSGRYSEYANGFFLAELLEFLMAGTFAKTITVRSIEEDRDVITLFPGERIPDFRSYFESRARHGRWFVVADSTPMLDTGIVELLGRLTPRDFVLYTDLDDGLIAVIGSELGRKLFGPAEGDPTKGQPSRYEPGT